jgi:hypothetical protein
MADARGARVRLRDAYLEPWTAAAPMTTVRVAWLLAAPLGALHQAVSYQHILKNVEPASRPELDWTSFCLREVLRTVDERA